MRANRQSRKALLARVHILAKELGLSEDARRDLQTRITGHESCAKMSDRQLHAVLVAMEEVGKPAPEYREYTDPRARKVCAIWKQLFDADVVKNGSPQALNKFIEGQVKISTLGWVQKNKDFDAILFALRGMARRAGVRLHE